MNTKKRFVLDTNVILHDYKCIYNFEENDIYIPIVVLEEVDKFKKENDQINFNAREFIRELDSITDDDFFKKGASLGEGLGKLFIITEMTISKDFPFSEKIYDNLILSATEQLSKSSPKIKTILVSKDVNLRMKAKAVGVLAEDYFSDKVADINIFNKENPVFENIDNDIIDRIYGSTQGEPIDSFYFKDDICPNDCFVLKSDRASVLARYNPETDRVQKVGKNRTFGIEPRNAEQAFALDVLLDDNIKLVGVTGKAGTGKTLLALAAALQMRDKYQQILLARPIVALSNKDLGFLPGDEKEKMAPYMQPLFDNLTVIKNQFSSSSKEITELNDMQKSGKLVIEALAYIRGRSLSETYFIIDEAQNLTPHEIKTIITRAGENTKIVFTGDVQQIDSPYLDAQSNGLAYMIDKMKGQSIFAHTNLIKGERSKLAELASDLL